MAVASNASVPRFLYGDGATTVFNLPVAVEVLNSVKSFVTGTLGITDYTIVSGAPAAGDVQFTGSPGSPDTTLTFEAAPAVGSIIIVDTIPAGTL